MKLCLSISPFYLVMMNVPALIMAGAKGVISVIGNAMPEQYSKSLRGLKRNVKSLFMQYQLLDLIRMIYFEEIPGIKF